MSLWQELEPHLQDTYTRTEELVPISPRYIYSAIFRLLEDIM